MGRGIGRKYQSGMSIKRTFSPSSSTITNQIPRMNSTNSLRVATPSHSDDSTNQKNNNLSKVEMDIKENENLTPRVILLLPIIVPSIA